MSISPAQIISPVGETPVRAPAADSRGDAASRAKNPAPTFPPDSENVPKPDGPASKSAPTEPQLPEDEVQLQRDSELQNELIVRYVDKAGNLILQVPGAQMLDCERAIAAEFHHSEARAVASAGEQVGQSGESHGH
jgi:hypothetical protein